MRSRREEYTKRFEELTKQEIKNYNDSLLATHVAMNEFRGKLKECVDLYAQQVAQLSSKMNSMEAENIDLKKDLKALSRKLESQVNDFNRLEREKIEGGRQINDFKEWVKKEVSSLFSSFCRLGENVQEQVTLVGRRIDDASQGIGKCYLQTKTDNEKLKEEILALPSEAEKVKGELLAKISAFAIDNAGVTKELEVFKKQMLIQGKMNEYVHTRLDRIKKTLKC